MKKEVTHSRAYHRFFEGYAETKHFDAQETMHIERVYVGRYYRRDLSDRQHLLYRFFYAALYVTGLLAYLWAGTRETGAGLAWYTAVPSALSLLAVIWLAIPLLRGMAAPREMIVRTYRDTHEDLIRASLIAAVLQLLNAAAVPVSLLLIPGQNCMLALASAAVYCVSCAVFFWLSALERQTPYQILPPRAERPEDSSIIRYQNNY